MLLARRFPLLHRPRQLAFSSSQSLSTDALLLDSELLIKKEEEATTAEATLTDYSANWVILPPVPRVKELARVVGQSELTAIKWITRCCPEISHTSIEKLFRTRQVRVCSSESKQMEEANGAKLKRVTRKDVLPEGSILYLKRFAVQQIADKVEATDAVDDGGRKPSLMRRIYKPTQDDIEWARELVLHLDDHIIAINKPMGLSVQGGSGVGRSLDDLLGPAYSFDYDDPPKLVHRLDKDTSGIMVIGRTQESTALLHDMFRVKTASATSSDHKHSEDGIRGIKRKYFALVIGTPNKRKGRIVAPLRKIVLDSGTSEAIVVAHDSNAEDALEAVTEYRVLGSSLNGCTWLELHPYTGRKHQLRVHCAQALGMPILGDYKYGRQVHERWLNEVKEDVNSTEEQQNTAPKRRNLPIVTDVKGSVTSERPFLHLHSRLLAIPKIRELKKKKPKMVNGQVSKEKIAFVDSLRLLAPLPPHMKASWNLLPPTMKKELHQQFVEKLGIKGECKN
ncbi:hypothetical protein GOP47_0000448 [Adiantum capillus-veneris]|uniref:Pseudouridine synthase RsuA/RluA-like domain-containing protein n=1 Tax=Adiantum capillus-veneris TaxID=13818 RepID=A0A9D4ZQJ9_ADICA|nr:hypothetical protein GOP47_0000448 [Adiantum capillus-veneris]